MHHISTSMLNSISFQFGANALKQDKPPVQGFFCPTIMFGVSVRSRS